jgi:hypothetical protein
MRRPQGYAQLVGPGLPSRDEGLASLARHGEADTFTCGHCQAIVIVPARASVGGYCRVCNRLVCEKCASAQRCAPFEQQLEHNLRKQAYLAEW